MDPAEDIVSLWLMKQGFFIRSGVEVGFRGKEIDLLAVDPKNNRRVHVEVHVSVFPLGPLRPWSPAKYGRMPIEDRIKYYYYNKFVGATEKGTGKLLNRCIEKKASEAFGNKDYERWLVLGQLQDDPKEIKKEFAKYGVKVFFLKEILEQIRYKGTAKDSTGRFLQILASQLTKEAKKALLGKR